jgi:hypothetical protein
MYDDSSWPQALLAGEGFDSTVLCAAKMKCMSCWFEPIISLPLLGVLRARRLLSGAGFGASGALTQFNCGVM